MVYFLTKQKLYCRLKEATTMFVGKNYTMRASTLKRRNNNARLVRLFFLIVITCNAKSFYASTPMKTIIVLVDNTKPICHYSYRRSRKIWFLSRSRKAFRCKSGMNLYAIVLTIHSTKICQTAWAGVFIDTFDSILPEELQFLNFIRRCV